MTAADRLRFLFHGIAEGLMFSLLSCVLGVLTLQLATGPETVEDPPRRPYETALASRHVQGLPASTTVRVDGPGTVVPARP